MGSSSAQRAAAAEKRAKAVALRLAGLDWATVAQQSGYRSPGAACTAVSEALKAAREKQAASAEELRQLTAMRYERLLTAAWGKAVKGDVKAIETAARIVDRMVKLEGLAAPEKVDVDLTGQITADDLMALIRSGRGAADADG
jgi:hypothetical protein